MILSLLSRLMSGKVTTNEYDSLKSEINRMSDQQLHPIFQTLWEEERSVYAMPVYEKMQVLARLNSKTNNTARWIRFLKIAAAVILPILVWETVNYVSKESITREPVTVMTDAGQKTHMLLSDGTEVWINSNSSVSYDMNFGVKNRTVKLKGEAYFDVTKKAKQKFVVEAGGINIVVYGTRFNISAHPQNPTIEVSLIEGSLVVENKEHEQLAFLHPNHIIRVNKQNLRWNISSGNTEDVSLWRLNKCRIEGATAAEVFQKLEYWYGMKIEVEHMNTQYKYSFTIKNETIRELLELINELTPLEYSIDGEEVYVRYQ